MTSLNERPEECGATCKRVLILGASFLQVPMIRAAKRLGYWTIVVDQNPDAVGAPLADEFFEISTLDTDAVLAVARSRCIDGITTAATDAPVRVLAAVGQELGLPAISVESSVLCTDKLEMVRRFAREGVPHPAFAVIDRDHPFVPNEQPLDFPFIVKPVDSSGSRGVTVVRSESELGEARDYARRVSRSDVLLAEELLVGREVSCELFHDGRAPHILAITDKQTSGAPHFVEVGHSQPSALGDEERRQIEDVALSAARALGVTWGPGHIEMMLTARGPVLIELGARLGGDFITSHLVPISTGIDMVGLVVAQAVGDPVCVPEPADRGSAVQFLEMPIGVLAGVRGIEEAQIAEGVVEANIDVPLGHQGTGTNSSSDRLGHVIAGGATAEEARSRAQAAASILGIEVVE